MDRERVIALVEGEIHRKRALAEIADKDLKKAHLDVAKALQIVLAAYQESRKICMTGEKNWRLR